MTLWDRLWGKARPVADSPLPPEDSRDEEEDQADEGERALAEAVTRLERGEGLEAVMDATLNDALAALVDAGSAHRAANWLDRFVAVAAPDEACARLRLRIATLRIGSGDRRAASPHLRALTEHPEHGARAWFLLGDIAERASDTDEALFAYESCLALDLDYPNVKSRIDALNRRLGEARPKGPDAPTMAGLGRDARGPMLGAGGRPRYSLLRELGRGATGAVYLARDEELDREVAVKLLHPHLHVERQARARALFFHEARVAASLRHPNIVAILDIDEQKRVIVMELCAHGTLRQHLGEGPLPVHRAVAHHAEVLSALVSAHRRGVVHRDLKPANLLYRRPPSAIASEIVLCDFGIAHLADAADAAERRSRPRSRSRRPSAAHAPGTLAYMAPEQRAGKAVAASDVYAAAVILFETLTGRLPWSRDVALRGTRTRSDLALPAELAAGTGTLHVALNDHLTRLGHPDAAERPDAAAAHESARALERLARV